MLRIISVICFTFVLFTHSTTLCANTSGPELLANCQTALDAIDNNFGRVQTEGEYLQGNKAGKCQGFLSSVNEMYLLNSAIKNNLPLKYCLPNNYNSLEGASAVVQYLKKYPQQKNQAATLIVLQAFQYYFPC
jgi:hypothetical protein